MKGITVILCERIQTGVNPFNKPIYSETETEVENVLVSPITQGGEEALDAVDLQGRKASYILGIPKGDTHSWEGCKVKFFNEIWQVIGKPTEGIDHLIPLAWNKKVLVDHIE